MFWMFWNESRVSRVSEQLDKVTFHFFIAKAHGSYFKQQKKNLLDENDVIALVDFAENHKFLVQDEIQKYTI